MISCSSKGVSTEEFKAKAQEVESHPYKEASVAIEYTIGDGKQNETKKDNIVFAFRDRTWTYQQEGKDTELVILSQQLINETALGFVESYIAESESGKLSGTFVWGVNPFSFSGKINIKASLSGTTTINKKNMTAKWNEYGLLTLYKNYTELTLSSRDYSSKTVVNLNALFSYK